MNYHPKVDPGNPKFEPGLSPSEYVKLFPYLVQERPNLSKPFQLYCVICDKEIDGKSGANIKRHLTGKYHILKYKSESYGAGTFLTTIVENHPETFKIFNGQLLCKVCRSILNSTNPGVQKHLTCKWHVKCEKVLNDHKAQMENMTKDEFNTLLCESFAAANIPFERVDHPAMKNFIETISGMAVLHSSTLRELHQSMLEAEEGKDENEKTTSLVEIQDHEDYAKPSREAVKLEKRLQVKQRVVELVNSQPPKKKRKRDLDRQLKRETLSKVKNMKRESVTDTLIDAFVKNYFKN